jgi:hypothetical protein
MDINTEAVNASMEALAVAKDSKLSKPIPVMEAVESEPSPASAGIPEYSPEASQDSFDNSFFDSFSSEVFEHAHRSYDWEIADQRAIYDAVMADAEARGITLTPAQFMAEFTAAWAAYFHENNFYDPRIRQINELVSEGYSLEDVIDNFNTNESYINYTKVNPEKLGEADFQYVYRQLIKFYVEDNGLSESKAEKLVRFMAETQDGGWEEIFQEYEGFRRSREQEKNATLEKLRVEKENAERFKEEQHHQNMRSVAKKISQLESLAGFDLSDADRSNLFEYIFAPEEEGQSRYMRDLTSLDKKLEVAFLMMIGANKDKFKGRLQNEVVRGVKRDLSRNSFISNRSNQPIRRDDLGTIESRSLSKPIKLI